jgi:hypothetical protein
MAIAKEVGIGPLRVRLFGSWVSESTTKEIEKKVGFIIRFGEGKWKSERKNRVWTEKMGDRDVNMPRAKRVSDGQTDN